MSGLTVDGSPLLGLDLTMELLGCWQAKLQCEADELTGTVVIDDGAGQTFTGRVRRSGVVSGRNSALVVGGRGKLADGTLALAARHFRAVNLRTVATEILTQAGEQLAATSQASLLAQHLTFWSFGASSPGAALLALVEPFGGTWRVLSDGTVWLGVDSYPAAPEQDRLELEPEDANGLVHLAVDSFALRPGVTLDGRKVLQVQHLLASEGRRTDYRYG